MALRRTLGCMARYDVQPHLEKLWKAYKPAEGQVVRSLSPFEQKIVSPFMSNYPAEAMKNVKEAVVDIVPAFVLLAGIGYWGTNYYHQLQYHHRD
eukprot:CAMPEP_0118963466 /NCGR_PEP_ID=MMETSP1173-20130426/1349_1 /TAXON_ID=1034831 /ORGANISM="Rhizochromulina marina cf, Strain CCMP1243" /LENGTH=94 /DNA_ID=CAMNT_0006911797 /DNA_START=24 /DNA_END=308 /DNA_ORIENTATION=-